MSFLNVIVFVFYNKDTIPLPITYVNYILPQAIFVFNFIFWFLFSPSEHFYFFEVKFGHLLIFLILDFMCWLESFPPPQMHAHIL